MSEIKAPAEVDGLPPLPEARKPDEHGLGWFTAGQMHEYARATLAHVQPKHTAEPVGEVFSISAMRPDEDAYATVRLLHRATDQWGLKVRAGDKLYAQSPAPGAALSQQDIEDLAEDWATEAIPDIQALVREVERKVRATQAPAVGAETDDTPKATAYEYELERLIHDFVRTALVGSPSEATLHHLDQLIDTVRHPTINRNLRSMRRQVTNPRPPCPPFASRRPSSGEPKPPVQGSEQ